MAPNKGKVKYSNDWENGTRSGSASRQCSRFVIGSEFPGSLSGCRLATRILHHYRKRQRGAIRTGFWAFFLSSVGKCLSRRHPQQRTCCTQKRRDQRRFPVCLPRAQSKGQSAEKVKAQGLEARENSQGRAGRWVGRGPWDSVMPSS